LGGLLSFIGCGDDKGTDSPPPPQNDLDRYVSVASSDMVGMLADPSRPRVYIADVAQDVIHIFNTGTYQIETSINVGSDPTFLDIKSDYSLLFATLAGDTLVAVIDLDSLKTLDPIEVPGNPTGIAVGANDRLYVSSWGPGTPKPPITIYDISSLPISETGIISKGDLGIYICGGRNDYNGLYTHDVTTSLNITQWDISGGSGIEIRDGDIGSGGVKTNSCPSDSRIFLTWYGPTLIFNPRIDDGYLPIHRSSDLSKMGQLKVDYSPTAVAISHSGDTAYVTHNDYVFNPTYQDRHDPDRKDLHIFNTRDYNELGHFILPQYVDVHGIELGPDGRIYLLLGDGADNVYGYRFVTSAAIGVIEP
jgi:DNA-binding beta-propeller fold protein YncE